MTELPESVAADDTSCMAFLHDELDFDELSRRNFVVVIDMSTCACDGVMSMNEGVDSCDLMASSSPSSSSSSSPSPSTSSSSSASSSSSSCYRCDALTRCWRQVLQAAKGDQCVGSGYCNDEGNGDAGVALSVASMSDCCYQRCVPLMETSASGCYRPMQRLQLTSHAPKTVADSIVTVLYEFFNSHSADPR